MNIFKAVSDMKQMVHAAPGLIESADALAAQAQAVPATGFVYAPGAAIGSQQAQHAAARAAHGDPRPENLEPIAGVGLGAYALVVKGIAVYGYDESKLVEVAGSYGIRPADWASAQDGWSRRIQEDRGLGARFNELYTAA